MQKSGTLRVWCRSSRSRSSASCQPIHALAESVVRHCPILVDPPSPSQILGCLCNIAAFEGNWAAAMVVAGAVVSSLARHPRETKIVNAALWTLSNLANLVTNAQQLKPCEPAVVALLELHPDVESVVASGCTLLSRTLRFAVEPEGGEEDPASLAPAFQALVSVVVGQSEGSVQAVPSPLPLARLLQTTEAAILTFGDRVDLLRSAIIATHVALENLRIDAENLHLEAGNRDLHLARCRRLLSALVPALGTFGDDGEFQDAALRLLCFLFDDVEGQGIDEEMTPGRMVGAAQALGPILARALRTFASACTRIGWVPYKHYHEPDAFWNG